MEKLFTSFQSITKTQTIKDSAIVVIGMGLSTVFSALSIFLLARFLGPTQFGFYTVALTLAVIIIDAIDLGISSSIVKFGSQPINKESFIKYSFLLKLFIGLTLGILFAIFSQPLAGFLHPEIKKPLLYSSLIIPIIFLVRFPRSLLQSQKKFFLDTVIEVGTSFSRLGLVAVFYYFFQLTVIAGLMTYFLGNMAGFILGACFISWRFFKAKITKITKQKFFHFQKWLTLGFILAAFHGRIDSTILLKFSTPAEVGIYQAAYRFFMPALQLAAALSLVFAPRFASFANQLEARQYLKKASQLTFFLACAVLLIIPLSKFFIMLIFGRDYLSAVLPTQILSLGFFAFIAGAPYVSYLIYSAVKIKTFFYLSLFQLILIIALNLILIPKFQAVGTALAATITLIIVNLATAIISLKHQT